MSLHTEKEDNNHDKEKHKKHLYYCSDEYKKSIIEKLLPAQLADTITTKPIYHLKNVDHNTFIGASQINFNPVGGLVFYRDQCGTPVYMAPEIIKNNIGFPVDIW